MPRLALFALVASLSLAREASAQDTVKVGGLKLTSSAPIFVGVEHGFMKSNIPLKDIVDTSFLEGATTAAKD